jgi:hypothetical protein
VLHIELAVSSGFEDCNGIYKPVTISLGFVKFLISLFMTEDMLTRNGLLVLQSSRSSLKVVGLL